MERRIRQSYLVSIKPFIDSSSIREKTLRFSWFVFFPSAEPGTVYAGKSFFLSLRDPDSRALGPIIHKLVQAIFRARLL